MNPLIAIWHELLASNQLYPPPMLLTQHLRGADALSAFEATDFQQFIGGLIKDHFDTEFFPYRGLSEFLLASSSDGTNPVLDPSQHQKFETLRVLPFLVSIKKYITDQIGSAIRSRFFTGGIPNNGVSLVFTRQLQSAYLVTYDLRNALPEVVIVERFVEPKGVMEVDSISVLRNPMARNLAKAFLTGGHKIVLQHGILTHVDRRIDQQVFGPTIDTLYLADILLEAPQLHSNRVLEVGSGSGHVISSVACRLNDTRSCTSIDVNPKAISCTWRNLTGNLHHNEKVLERNYGVIGPFNIELFGNSFNLVVCNPPYIALPPKEILSDPAKYTEAVAGTQLLSDLLGSLDKLLAADGKLLLMASSTSLSAVENAVLPQFRLRPAYEKDGLRVPFDVEAVLSDPGWIEYLMKSNVLELKDDTYWHQLRPVWIERRGE